MPVRPVCKSDLFKQDLFWCGVVCRCVHVGGCVQDLGTPSVSTPVRRTAQNFALFSLSHHIFHSFFPLLRVLSLKFGGDFEFRDPQMCTFGVLGLPKPPGFNTTARELQSCTLEGPGVSNTTNIPRKETQVREGNCSERREKREILGPPTLLGPTLRGPQFARWPEAGKAALARSGIGLNKSLQIREAPRACVLFSPNQTQSSCPPVDTPNTRFRPPLS